jgi:hypothetical protein
MLRATASLLLFGAVALLVTWGVRPAASQSTRTPPRVAADTLPALPAELNEIDLEVERLSARLDRKTGYPPPSRDPFNFAPSARTAREVAMPVDLPLPPTEIIRPSWPSLVAIMTKLDGVGLEVALTDRAGEVHVLGGGGVLGSFLVTELTAEAVTLSDQVSGQSTRLSIR